MRKPDKKPPPERPLDILILEDAPADAELMQRELKKAKLTFTARRVDTREGFCQGLKGAPPDLILADYRLPSFDGIAALAIARQECPEVPFVFVSGSIGEERAIETLKRGATDYVLKEKLVRLAPVVKRALQETVNQRKRRQAEERAQSHLRSLNLLIAGVEKLATVRDPEAVIQEICQLVLDAFEAHLVWLGRVEPEGRVRPLWWAGDPGVRLKEGELRLADADPRTGMSVVYNDHAAEVEVAPGFAPLRFQNFQTSATFPLVREDRTFGVLKVFSDRADFFPPERLELLQAYARIAAAALENARLNAQAERRLQQLGALRLIDLAITASLDPRVTLNVLLDQVTEQLGMDAAAVLLPVGGLQMLEYTAMRGFRGKVMIRSQIRLGEGFLGQAALERRLVHIPDLQAAGEAQQAPALAREGFVTGFAVPLLAKGQVKGVLGLFHRAYFPPDGEWLEFLEALAGQAAVAIDNAALFDSLQKSHAELEMAYEATLEGWAKALELRHDETKGHSQRVVELTLRLARLLGLDDQELRHLRRGALLHDIGKIGIPDNILTKPGPLTEEEWRIMQLHPVFAYELLSPISYLRSALDIPYCHHEKWDGSGYPRGLQGEAIPLAARIFAVVDVWEALNSERPYRRAWSRDKVKKYLREQAGRHFDPRVVEVFLNKVVSAEEQEEAALRKGRPQSGRQGLI